MFEGAFCDARNSTRHINISVSGYKILTDSSRAVVGFYAGWCPGTVR
jgi:hypothetical protein